MPRNMYQQALDSQSACNLSGLCHSMAKVADEIWTEIRADDGFSNTRRFNEHPVMRLLAEQIYFLTTNGSGRNYSEAFEICEIKAKGDIGHGIIQRLGGAV